MDLCNLPLPLVLQTVFSSCRTRYRIWRESATRHSLSRIRSIFACHFGVSISDEGFIVILTNISRIYLLLLPVSCF